MEIRRFTPGDASALRELLVSEGADWAGYHEATAWERYRRALAEQMVLVAVDDGRMLGYLRAMNDFGFGIYVMDLLVARAARGRRLGRALLDVLRADTPGTEVYVLSDADGFYSRQNYRRAGTIFEIPE